MAKFTGFTTIDRCRKFTITDDELVKRDLLNILQIRAGELPGRPEVGTRIWDFIFEPSTPNFERQVAQELERVIQKDPRIQLNDIIVYVADHEILLELDLTILPNIEPERLIIKFNEDTNQASFV